MKSVSTTDRDFCLRSVAYLKAAIPSGEGSAMPLSEYDSPILTNLGNGLLVAYVVDEDSSFSYAQGRHLRAAQLSIEQLHQAALANLSLLVKENAQVKQHGNIYAVLMDGNFEASVLLIESFWSQWYCNLAPNGFIAALPARDLLAFGDQANALAVEELKQLCARAAGRVDHPLSSDLFRRIHNSWQIVTS
jgi:uncharacterized protein YtpQ (UPF0354 family)